MKKNRIMVTLALAAVVALAAIPALAGDAAEPAPAPAIQAAAPASFAGVLVQIDPRTGEIRQPTAEEARQIREEMNRRYGTPRARSAAPVVWTLAGGGTAAEVDPELYSYGIARIDENGTLVTDCIDGHQAAQAALDSTPAARGEE